MASKRLKQAGYFLPSGGDKSLPNVSEIASVILKKKYGKKGDKSVGLRRMGGY